jgi:hypothetical protein
MGQVLLLANEITMAAIFIFGSWNVIADMRIPRLVRKIKPQLYEEFRSRCPVVGRFFPYNPFRFRDFVNSGDDLGSAELALTVA